MEQRLENLDYLFHPRSIAFIGATETMGKWGFMVFNNLIVGGYKGKQSYPLVRRFPSWAVK
jgi:acyl-CoA synthetase (NDP forming)